MAPVAGSSKTRGQLTIARFLGSRERNPDDVEAEERAVRIACRLARRTARELLGRTDRLMPDT